jgi:hypothetical protein
VKGRLIAFLGPSLPAREARALGASQVLPPAGAGDVWAALALRPQALALIDGVFESQPSVWHRELLDALAAGVAVFGGASMGALRAAELAPFGMVGVGEIYAAYRNRKLIDDGEVALLHADAEHGYRALTEALVNVRHNVERARAAGVVNRREAREVVRAAEAIFYQERTWPRLLASARVAPAVREQLERFPREDLKARDARACVKAAAAFVRAGAPALKVALPRPPSHARRRRVVGGAKPTAAALRRALLVGFGRSVGLEAAPDPGLEAALARAGMAVDLAQRLASDVALERLLLEHASRLVNDGPSPVEAADEERFLRRLRGRWRVRP